MTTEKASITVHKAARRNRKQIAADEKAVQSIATIVISTQPYNSASLRAAFDDIYDALVTAGRA